MSSCGNQKLAKVPLIVRIECETYRQEQTSTQPDIDDVALARPLEGHIEVGTAATCQQAIAPVRNAIRERVKKLMKLEPPYVAGARAIAGPCTARMWKLYRSGILNGPPTAIGMTSIASQMANHEERSCLELKIDLLDKACDCAQRGHSFSADESLQDNSMVVYGSIREFEQRARNRGIVNPAIRKYVDDASKIRDCFNQGSLDSLRNTQKALETIVGK
jgi:hypothetical protein